MKLGASSGRLNLVGWIEAFLSVISRLLNIVSSVANNIIQLKWLGESLCSLLLGRGLGGSGAEDTRTGSILLGSGDMSCRRRHSQKVQRYSGCTANAEIVRSICIFCEHRLL